MLKRSIAGIILCMMILLPALVLGKGIVYSGKWWNDAQTSRQLNLTEVEINQLDQQYIDSKRKLIQLKSDLEKEQFELETLLEAKDLDEKAIANQRGKLEKAREKLSKTRFDMVLEYRKILGKDRFQQLKTKMKIRRSKSNRK